MPQITPRRVAARCDPAYDLRNQLNRYRTRSMTSPTRVTTPSPSALSRPVAAVAVTLLFGINGMLLGGYGASLPSVRDKLGIDATGVAILLFCAGAAAITSMQIGGRLADAIGARTVTLTALPIVIA